MTANTQTANPALMVVACHFLSWLSSLDNAYLGQLGGSRVTSPYPLRKNHSDCEDDDGFCSVFDQILKKATRTCAKFSRSGRREK